MDIDRSTIGKVAIGLGVGVGAYLIYRKWHQYRWVEVGRISEIWIYPIKSCKGISVEEAECLGLGLKNGEYFDRRFCIADVDGKFLTARNAPNMVLLESRLENGILTLSAPGKESIKTDLAKIVAGGNVTRIRLWEDKPVDAFDCGSEISEWITDYVGRTSDGVPPFRLYYYTPGLFNSRTINNMDKYKPLIGSHKDLNVFPDLTPYMLMTESSMHDLNTRTPNGEQFSIMNFRPNFIVSGTKPFDEDKWAKVKIGDQTLFSNIVACTRCVLTTIDWTTGEKHPRTEPLRTLRSYRLSKNPEEKKIFGVSPMFGIHLKADRLGTVRVGDPIYVTYKSG